MAETIRIVRTLRNPRLYIDPHGGFREVSLVAEAVISLLKVEGIEVAGIYGIEHGQGKENKIVDGSAGFHIFDFVSGINEFINYGRANSLESFLKKSTRTDGEQEMYGRTGWYGVSGRFQKVFSCAISRFLREGWMS